jgi:putative copper export protein
VDGSFVFFVAEPGAAVSAAPAERVLETPRAPGVRLVAAALRGLGVGALAALAGLLFLTGMVARADQHARRLSMILAWSAPVLLGAHALAWALYARPPEGGESLRGLLVGTLPGQVEVARVGLAVLALWALALARRPGLALALAVAAIALTGATGHAAALHPAWSIPAKALHVAAVAVWAGGLATLFVTTLRDDALNALALRVSSLSLVAVTVITATGVLQTVLFAPSLRLLAASAYGAALLVKLAGMAVLVAIGARNRYRIVPRLPAAEARTALRRAVGWELGVMTVVLLAAGLLAYLPVPRPDPHPVAHPTPVEMNR